MQTIAAGAKCNGNQIAFPLEGERASGCAYERVACTDEDGHTLKLPEPGGQLGCATNIGFFQNSTLS
jgi:hypothetical protein